MARQDPLNSVMRASVSSILVAVRDGEEVDGLGEARDHGAAGGAADEAEDLGEGVGGDVLYDQAPLGGLPERAAELRLPDAAGEAEEEGARPLGRAGGAGAKGRVTRGAKLRIRGQGLPKDDFHVHQSIDVKEVSQLPRKLGYNMTFYKTKDNSLIDRETETYARKQWVLSVVSWHLHNESLHTE